MITFELVNHLRLVASYHMGTDLLDRLTDAQRVQQQQREALNLAADRIEHLEAELAKAKADEWGVAHALVFGPALAQRLAEVQGQHGDPRHVPAARSLTDGRWMLTADILTECVPGGLIYGGFSHLDSARFGEIEVMPMAEAVALLPARPSPL